MDNHVENFFRELLQFQHFQQFVSERVDVLNRGQGINDIFEHTVAEYRERKELCADCFVKQV